MSEINELLAEIQQNLNAPKGQTNSFGNYKYRSCEDILEAVKPLLNGASLVISDKMVMLGDRYYVEATATIFLGHTDEQAIHSKAYAREELERKKFDVSQLTGAASSYARKYALNGLFAIDDTKDADTTNTKEKVSPEPVNKEKVSKAVLFFMERIDYDVPEETAEKIKTAYSRLSNDEKSEVNEQLSVKAPGSNKMYKTLLKDHLEYSQ